MHDIQRQLVAVEKIYQKSLKTNNRKISLKIHYIFVTIAAKRHWLKWTDLGTKIQTPCFTPKIDGLDM